MAHHTQVELETMEGSLQLHGQGQWLNHRLRFRGEATAQPDAEAALSNLLNVLGQRRGNPTQQKLSAIQQFGHLHLARHMCDSR